MDGKTIVEGWGYDSERCPHTHIKQFPKLYCKLCMAADIDAALAAAKDSVYLDAMGHFNRMMNDEALDGQYEHLVFCSGSRKVPFGTKGVSCCCANVPAIKRLLAAARAEELEALKCCVEFTRLALERWEETECMMDGADVQEVLQESGVLVETTYDPAIHGEQDAEPGDPWLVFSPAWNAIRRKRSPSMGNHTHFGTITPHRCG